MVMVIQDTWRIKNLATAVTCEEGELEVKLRYRRVR